MGGIIRTSQSGQGKDRDSRSRRCLEGRADGRLLLRHSRCSRSAPRVRAPRLAAAVVRKSFLAASAACQRVHRTTQEQYRHI